MWPRGLSPAAVSADCVGAGLPRIAGHRDHCNGRHRQYSAVRTVGRPRMPRNSNRAVVSPAQCPQQQRPFTSPRSSRSLALASPTSRGTDAVRNVGIIRTVLRPGRHQRLSDHRGGHQGPTVLIKADRALPNRNRANTASCRSNYRRAITGSDTHTPRCIVVGPPKRDTPGPINVDRLTAEPRPSDQPAQKRRGQYEQHGRVSARAP